MYIPSTSNPGYPLLLHFLKKPDALQLVNICASIPVTEEATQSFAKLEKRINANAECRTRVRHKRRKHVLLHDVHKISLIRYANKRTPARREGQHTGDVTGSSQPRLLT